MKALLLLLFLNFTTGFVAAQQSEISFIYPVKGVLGKDYVIVNHVDHDNSEGIRDYSCGVQTYDGHQGTDFCLKSFRQMDSGVTVIAAAAGRVIQVVDTLFDRNKESVKSRGFGNYVAIEHKEGYITYYAHIRTNSAVVKVGDEVRQGAALALVGSSGNSSDPHVHFEVWKNIDPFQGACNNTTSLFANQTTYTTSYRLLDAGVTTWPPVLDTLRERPENVTLITQADTTITFWCLQQGIQVTDSINITWISPTGSIWFEYNTVAGITSNYFYWWSYIYTPNISGEWIVQYSINGVLRSQQIFTRDGPSVGIDVPTQKLSITLDGNRVRSTNGEVLRVSAYNILGQLILQATATDIDLNIQQPAFIVVEQHEKRVVIKY